MLRFYEGRKIEKFSKSTPEIFCPHFLVNFIKTFGLDHIHVSIYYACIRRLGVLHSRLACITSHSLQLLRFYKISLSVLTALFSRCTWVNRYQNVSVLDFIGADFIGAKI